MATFRVTTPFALLGLAILFAGCAADGSADKPRYFSEGTSTIDARVEAIDYASRHPMAYNGRIEIRPFHVWEE